jgi:hypothetical protein
MGKSVTGNRILIDDVMYTGFHTKTTPATITIPTRTAVDDHTVVVPLVDIPYIDGGGIDKNTWGFLLDAKDMFILSFRNAANTIPNKLYISLPTQIDIIQGGRFRFIRTGLHVVDGVTTNDNIGNPQNGAIFCFQRMLEHCTYWRGHTNWFHDQHHY